MKAQVELLNIGSGDIGAHFVGTPSNADGNLPKTLAPGETAAYFAGGNTGEVKYVVVTLHRGGDAPEGRVKVTNDSDNDSEIVVHFCGKFATDPPLTLKHGEDFTWYAYDTNEDGIVQSLLIVLHRGDDE